jgi:hypothetical protein
MAYYKKIHNYLSLNDVRLVGGWGSVQDWFIFHMFSKANTSSNFQFETNKVFLTVQLLLSSHHQPRHITSLTQGMYKMHHITYIHCDHDSTYFDTKSYTGEAKCGIDNRSQGRHDEDGNTLHSTHGGDVAYEHPGVHILSKKHTANWCRLQTTCHSIYTQQQTLPATRFGTKPSYTHNISGQYIKWH